MREGAPPGASSRCQAANSDLLVRSKEGVAARVVGIRIAATRTRAEGG